MVARDALSCPPTPPQFALSARQHPGVAPRPTPPIEHFQTAGVADSPRRYAATVARP